MEDTSNRSKRGGFSVVAQDVVVGASIIHLESCRIDALDAFKIAA